jgi:redox-sensitive bicupin YhaK (pirin superfamily)
MKQVTRRDALKAVAAAGVATGALSAATCKKQEVGSAMEAKRSKKQQADVITAVTPLSFPWQTDDPFLFCVHHDDRYPAGNDRLGPAASLDGRDLGQDFAGKDGWRMYHGGAVPGFPQHPHRGFETVTVVRRGLLDHSDSMGATARYGGGDVQWLTAGRGILHAEMFPLVDPRNPNPLELFQIWLNLPIADKMTDPHFSMLWSHLIPRHVGRDAAGRAIEVALTAGRYGNAVAPPPPPKSWAAHADADVAIWTIKLEARAQWTLPVVGPKTNRSLYFFQGSGLSVGGRAVQPNHRIELRPGVEVALEAGPDETELLLLQGRPIGEPIVKYGPFVMSSNDEIRQAFADYQATRFGGWPWPSDEPVHARDAGRFARRPDGKTERPA